MFSHLFCSYLFWFFLKTKIGTVQHVFSSFFQLPFFGSFLKQKYEQISMFSHLFAVTFFWFLLTFFVRIIRFGYPHKDYLKKLLVLTLRCICIHSPPSPVSIYRKASTCCTEKRKSQRGNGGGHSGLAC